MKRIVLLVLVFVLGVLPLFSYSPAKLSIPDTAFLNALIIEGVDIDKDSVINEDEADSVTYLDVSEKGISDMTGIESFHNLDTLKCQFNYLTMLNLSNNSALSYLSVAYMPTLQEVCVWETFWTDSVDIDTADSPNVYFTTECLYDTIIYIPDIAFLYALIDEGVDTDGDSLISYTEADIITSLNLSAKDITDITPIQAFTNLGSLKLQNSQLTSLDLPTAVTHLDVSNSTALTELQCSGNQLTSLDVSNSTALTELNCGNNQLTSLDVYGCIALTKLRCSGNQLASLDVSNSTNLTELNCGDNQLTSLDVYGCIALTKLRCSGNQLASLDVSNSTSLKEVIFDGNPLTNLNFSNCISLEVLYYTGQYNLRSLDVSGCTALTVLNCWSNQLTSLDVSNNTALRTLMCNENQLTSLDVSSCTALTELICNGNQLTSLDVYSRAALTHLGCRDNQLTSLDVSNNTALTRLGCSNNQLTSLDLSNNTALKILLLEKMPTLYKVCVWESFPSSTTTFLVVVETGGSPNVCFDTYCDGVCISSSIDDQSFIGLSIYPNPANNHITIETVNPGLHTIEIHSLNGQLIYSTKMDRPTLQIDLSSFQKGLYFITVRTKDYVRTEKIIKL